MSLEDEIATLRPTIRTDGYPMSIGEWISLYSGKEIDIHPEFQRFFRWTDYQKTRLIESLLLGIPIPPIFVAQREDGVWDVVDGLQRLSTIYQFIGILKREDGALWEPLTLQSSKYLPSLEGKKWDDENDRENSMTASQQRDIKRSKISVNIILKESDEKSKFDLFERLNSGGSALTPQEVRNCLLVMLNRDMFKWLKELTEFPPFQESIAVSDRLLDEQYDMELALRFVILRKLDEGNLKGIKDVGEFITERMTVLATTDKPDFNTEKAAFEEVFTALNGALGSNAFRRFDPKQERYQGGFSISAFETVALGLGWNAPSLAISNEELDQRVRKLWSEVSFTSAWGAGVSASSRIPRVVPLGRRWFRP